MSLYDDSWQALIYKRTDLVDFKLSIGVEAGISCWSVRLVDRHE
jgi:hypothetical protein